MLRFIVADWTAARILTRALTGTAVTRIESQLLAAPDMQYPAWHWVRQWNDGGVNWAALAFQHVARGVQGNQQLGAAPRLLRIIVYNLTWRREWITTELRVSGISSRVKLSANGGKLPTMI